MNWFKRLCMFLFGLAGLTSLVTLSLSWVGPWTAKVRSLLELPWFLAILELFVLVAAIGLLGCVLVSLFYPRNPKETIVAEVEGGKITVTRHAIVSQVRHIVEDDGACKASSIRVKVRKRGNVRVSVRVKPNGPIDVISYGERLYARLSQGLAEVCGDSVKSIDVVFAEPVQTDQEVALQGGSEISVTPPATDTGSEDPAPSTEYVSVRPSVLSSMSSDETTIPSDDDASDDDAAIESPTVVLDEDASPTVADDADFDASGTGSEEV